jgi:glucose 1-dehydrogenase
MDKKLQGKVAIVTGSDSGIGQGIAIEFAKQGANVVVCYHTDKDGAEDTAKTIQSHGQKALVTKVDVSDEASIQQLFDATFKEFQTVDILVNNAGTNGPGKPLVEMEAKDFDDVIKTNLYSAFYTCKLFGAYRIKQGGGGKIINITSIHEDVASKNGSAYNASKGALKNLTRTLALELAEYQINVNNIGPGMIVTPINPDLMESKEALKEKGEKVPWKRAGYPDELGKLAVFLASEDADYVTGSSYFMDGGLMRQMGAEI